MGDLATRRQFLRLVILGSGGAIIAACAPAGSSPTPPPAPAASPAAPMTAPTAPAAAPQAAATAPATGAKINVASFAGAWVDGLNAGVVPCYTSKTGGQAEIVPGTWADWVQKINATKDQPALDVLIGTDGDVYRTIELGLIEKLDPVKMPNLQNILPRFKDQFDAYAFGFDGGRNGISFNTDKIKNPPQGWVELTERVAQGEFGRAVMYPHITAPDSLAVSWLINRELGGSITNPEPFFTRMKEMKPNILKYYTSNADPGTALTRGEIDLAVWTDGRTFGVQAAGNSNVEFVLPKPGSPHLTICMMKVMNGSDGAWEYLNCAADPANQAAWNKFFPGYYMTARDIEYPPGSKEKQDPTALDKSFANWIDTPWEELSQAWPVWVETWTREIGA